MKILYRDLYFSLLSKINTVLCILFVHRVFIEMDFFSLIFDFATLVDFNAMNIAQSNTIVLLRISMWFIFLPYKPTIMTKVFKICPLHFEKITGHYGHKTLYGYKTLLTFVPLETSSKFVKNSDACFAHQFTGLVFFRVTHDQLGSHSLYVYTCI